MAKSALLFLLLTALMASVQAFSVPSGAAAQRSTALFMSDAEISEENAERTYGAVWRCMHFSPLFGE
jgi:hypothetical protein